jgi:hypothetical protein
VQQGVRGKRRTRQEAAAVRQALAQGQTVAFATRHQWRHYTQRKPISAARTDGKP